MRTSSIFISYRIEDTLTQAGRLYDALVNEFGENNVFLDRNKLRPGIKWPTELNNKLNEAKIILILYRNGNDWLGVEEYGVRRIDNPEDWVRREVETALLDTKKIVIPILFNDAKLPPEAVLPPSIRELLYCSYKQIRERNWNDDLLPLIRIITEHLGNPNIVNEIVPGGTTEIDWNLFFKKNKLKPDLGPWMTVNCNRTEHYTNGLFKDFLVQRNESKNLVFFLSACLHQKPASLAKRLIYELIDNEMKIAHFQDARNVQEIAVIDLKTGLGPSETWVNFWKLIQQKFSTTASDPQLLATTDRCNGKDWIALLFRVPEKRWDDPFFDHHIAFIIEKFNNLPMNSRKFLIFFAFEFKNAHAISIRHADCEKRLQKLDQLVETFNSTSDSVFIAQYKLFPPVNSEFIEIWFEDVAHSPNKDRNRLLLETLRKQLHPADQFRPDFDMEKIEYMQNAAYQFFCLPQSNEF